MFRIPVPLGIALHVLAGAAIIVSSMAPSPVQACSCRGFEDRGFLGPRDGRLPANAAGVAWYVPWTRYQLEAPGIEELERRFTVEIRDGGTFRQLPVSVTPVEGFLGVYVVGAAGEGLKVGTTYRFTVDKAHPRGYGLRQVVVTVDRDGLPADAELGLQIGPATSASVHVPDGASCSARIMATQVAIDAILAPHASRWREQLLYRSILDGYVEWNLPDSACSLIPPGRSRAETGRDRYFVSCESSWFSHDPPALAPGRHTLQMQAFLPGTDIVLETPVESVFLPCS